MFVFLKYVDIKNYKFWQIMQPATAHRIFFYTRGFTKIQKKKQKKKKKHQRKRYAGIYFSTRGPP